MAYSFHWLDYVVCALSLAVGPILSVYFMITGGRQKTTKEYLLGDKNMNVVSVGASMLASGLNSVFLLGGTAEVYYRGAIYMLMGLCFIPITIVSCVFFIPAWRKLEVTSAYEYLEIRYNSLAIRQWGAFLFSIKLILFLSVVLYTPAMALSQVTGMNMHISIILCGSICGLYTVLGGLKAVVWTDTVQAFIMIIGMIVVCVCGTVQAGGPSTVWNVAQDTGRFNFNNFDANPEVRHTVWTILIGYSITWMMPSLSDQTWVQRFQAVKSARDAKIAYLINTLICNICLITVGSAGLIANAYFKDCDPLENGDITKGDQLLPYFFMTLLGPYHGLPGLFISAIFAAALSTVSSAINSLAAVFLEDFLKPFCKMCGNPIDKSKEHIYAKVLSAVFGVLAISLSYLAPLMGDVIIQIPPTVFGAIGGPLFSLFFLGFFVPFSNKWGALLGSIIGLTFDLWLGIGAIVYGKSAEDDNLPVGMCYNTTAYNITTNQESWHNATETSWNNQKSGFNMFNMSYVWFGILGLFISVVSGVIISAITNAFGVGDDMPRNDKTYENELQEKKHFLKA